MNTDNLDIWNLYYYPICFLGFFVSIIMSQVLLSLYRSSQATQNNRTINHADRAAGIHKKWRHFLRPTWFIVAFFIIFVFLLSFDGSIRTNEDLYVQSAQEFVTCLLGPGK